MKYPLLAVTLSILLLSGCGSDDNTSEEVIPPVPPSPPAVNSVNIDEAMQINVVLNQFDQQTGTIQFSLTDAQQAAITAAKAYDIYYFGFPDSDKASSNPKAWKRWHTTQSYRCQNTTECGGKLTETQTGQYQFEIPALDWQQQDPSHAVAQIKVAIQIYGARANNELSLIEAPSI